MTLFADSSALVTRYAEEIDRPALPIGAVVISALARVEVPSAIWRKHRLGELSAADASTLVGAFEADYATTVEDPRGFAVVVLTPGILDHAAQLVRRHALRAYDAVQLSTAVAVAEAVPECRTVACYDHRLRDAASAEGFSLFPPG